MTVTRLEDLPSELWLELFSYFTWFQLNSTWVEWRLNNRIHKLALLAQSRVAFEITPMLLRTWDQCLSYFEHQHSTMAHRITSLVLDEPILSREIIRRWMENDSSFFPRIRRCTVFVELIGHNMLSNLIRLIHQNKSTLHSLVMYFNRLDDYEYTLREIISHDVSVHTMKLMFVEDGRHYCENRLSSNTFFDIPSHLVAFLHTVSFRLSLRRIADLLILIQHCSLPRVQYLHVTVEKSFRKWNERTRQYEELPCYKLCSNDFHSSLFDLPDLRTFHLQQVSMSDIIVLIQHLASIVRLESLTVVNSNVKDRDELNIFKTSMKTRLYCLRKLKFILNLPDDTVFEDDDLYWFNLGHRGIQYEIDKNETESKIVLYTLPYSLNCQRQVRNNAFIQHSQIERKIDYIQWVVDDDPLSIENSLVYLQNTHFLKWFYVIQKSIPSPRSWCLIFPFLRYVELNFEENPYTSGIIYDGTRSTPISHRSILLEQIRINAPSLQCLTLSWDDILLLESGLPWSSLDQLNIRLSVRRQDVPDESLLGRVVTGKAFPQLRYLSFGRRRFRLAPPEVMAQRVLSWFDILISSLSTLSIFHVNKRCCYYRSKPKSAIGTLMTLIRQHVHLNNPSAHVIIHSNEEIIIWL
ncbi:unnamed protein product [Adineta ricciae]|uniref:F-box domain-containing protein n=1 Tax=Adineta ricciae TaxID=249248 RepID=A0A815P640_ADIRI|nr:unnamed protein product [Adineta ricciae]CAF1643767.1 unnamed protein product [Adineta ricciae]